MYSWINELIDKGYKYIIMPKKNSRSFWATKSNQTKDGSFRVNSSFDMYNLLDGEEWIPGDDTKGLYIKLV